MLQIIRDFRKLNMGQLSRLYEEEIQFNGAKNYPYLDQNRQILESEQDAYAYYREFLSQSDAFFAVWLEDQHYQCGMRVEPYRDGVLITGLETHPSCRCSGYASMLMEQTRDYLLDNGVTKIYSHIRNDNLPSIRVHRKCGFIKIQDTASFLDHSADIHSGTYLLQK